MPATIAITRRLEFDAGHRLPNHKSQCRNIHGHRYALEITLSSDVIREEGAADDGMVMDFGDIKRIANEKLVDLWDHAFLVHRGDSVMVDFLAAISGHKTVILDVVPTAETWLRPLSPSLRTRTTTASDMSWPSHACGCTKHQIAGRMQFPKPSDGLRGPNLFTY